MSRNRFAQRRRRVLAGTESAEGAVVIRPTWLFALTLALSGCAEHASPAQAEAGAGTAGAAGAAGADEASVAVGVPGGTDQLDFVPLEEGAVLRLQTFGQGGTHVIVAVRSIGFGKRAFVSATLRNVDTGVEVSEPPPARPQLLYCSDEGFCDLVPYLVHASGLTDTDEEKDGLHVELTARVAIDDGHEAHAMREVILSTADL